MNFLGESEVKVEVKVKVEAEQFIKQMFAVFDSTSISVLNSIYEEE